MFYKLQSWLSRQLQPKAFIEKDKSIAGKIILVTGASRGIGKAISEYLETKGGVVIRMERQPGKSTKADSYRAARFAYADITNNKSVSNEIDRIERDFGRIDVVVNCAGIFRDSLIDKTSVDQFNQMLQVNVGGAFNLCRYTVPYMKKRGTGLIINIGSKISHNTNVAPGKVTYATSKYALEGFSFALNKELKPFGIRVCCLMPGTVGTFVSRKSKQYLSPYDVASVVKFIIEADNVDFESLVFKSTTQNL